MSVVEGSQVSSPAACLGVATVALFSFGQNRPDGMEFTMFTEQMLTAEP